MKANRTVVACIAASGVAVVAGSIAKGQLPSGRRLLALGVVGASLAGVATVQPRVAAPLAGLVLAGVLTVTGADALGAVKGAATSTAPASAQPSPALDTHPSASSGAGGAAGGTPAAAAGSGTLGGKAVAYARQQIGKPYVWGAEGPDGFDCSGLWYAAYKSAGKTIPRVTYDQWDQLPHADMAALLPGDLIFYEPGPSGPEHVVGYAGNGSIVEAPHTGATVYEHALTDRHNPMGARRPT